MKVTRFNNAYKYIYTCRRDVHQLYYAIRHQHHYHITQQQRKYRRNIFIRFALAVHIENRRDRRRPFSNFYFLIIFIHFLLVFFSLE